MKITSVLAAFTLLMALFTDGLAQKTNADSLAKRHEEMMSIIMTKPKVLIKTIGIYVYDGYNTLDAIGRSSKKKN